MSMVIRDATLEEIWALIQRLPEFDDRHQLRDLSARVAERRLFCRIAEVEGEHAGFKLGYAENPQNFYSWLGGVLPAYRQRGIAKSLLLDQEQWCRDQGWQSITVKTRNRFTAMLLMLISQHYQITACASQPCVHENTLTLIKIL
ncbi:GNAT family N-acetyltransferase [Enterobacterales bacterium CwR94]|nr:GNAT family N-acetyltransferase [Enterobacterales bacterium CwR94]